jgi:acyl-CoA synthetase (AMP-forming)/AMP-acid ligase II/thioesterase domain-containing protein
LCYTELRLLSSNPHDLNSIVYTIISNWAKRTPDAIVIEAPDRPPLTYGHLYIHIKNTVETLNTLGVGREDRVAMVLPNGPEMAVAFLAVSSGATCAPLNPQYRAEEFDFFLSDLNAKALIIQSGMDSPALNIAQKKGIALIQLSPISEAGIFDLKGEAGKHEITPGFAQPEDNALVLHTSGTTSRPKLVPLTHSNICTSANNIRETLELKSNDRCLNVMPLFHIHGLIGAILSSISAGGTIVCTSGFYAPRFFEWMKRFRPTWYTAVPTMHQAILTRAQENKKIIAHSKLRFIRSCSSALPSTTMVTLEQTFKVPVIESYGMTEAAHQIASNPLPPRKRKAASVGVAFGTDVAIMDERGNLLPKGEEGEIVIRGPNVTKGYENNAEANKKAFTNGWFRTGDQGHFDEDNYLTITDRIKEIINRGGEKISPREIDEILLNHPNILQAVTFAVPDPKLGEEVAAAVVLRDKSTLEERKIQEYVASRIADFKVPRRILILDEIPKGSTGKIQRIGLAEKLGLVPSVNNEPDVKGKYRPPHTPLEKRLAKIWSEVLGIAHVGVTDNFFQLGGDSIQARLITARLGEELKIQEIPLVIFLYAPTIEKMANILSDKKISLPSASLTAIQSMGSMQPIYCVHACDGEVLFFTGLAHYLGPEQPFYAFRAQGLDGKTAPYTRVEEIASHYVKELQAIQPEGPYFLGGAGVGGIVAFEMAQQLKSHAKRVGLLILMDTILPKPYLSGEYSSVPLQNLRNNINRIASYIEKGEVFKTVKDSLKDRYGRITHNIQGVLNYEVWMQVQKAVDRYVPKPYSGRVILLLPEKRAGFRADPRYRIDPWRRFATGRFEVQVIPGEHLGIFKEPNVQVLARHLKTYLRMASEDGTN